MLAGRGLDGLHLCDCARVQGSDADGCALIGKGDISGCISLGGFACRRCIEQQDIAIRQSHAIGDGGHSFRIDKPKIKERLAANADAFAAQLKLVHPHQWEPVTGVPGVSATPRSTSAKPAFRTGINTS